MRFHKFVIGFGMMLVTQDLWAARPHPPGSGLPYTGLGTGGSVPWNIVVMLTLLTLLPALLLSMTPFVRLLVVFHFLRQALGTQTTPTNQTLIGLSLILTYSTSQVDHRRVGKLAMAIQVAFQELGVFPTSSAQIPVDTKDPVPFNTVQAIDNAERTAAMGRIAPSPKGVLSSSTEDGNLSSLRKELEVALAPEITRHDLALRSEPDGLVISLREVGFFTSGSAEIKAGSRDSFDRIAHLLAERPYAIRIEGHTDNVPIHNPRFASNWELSTTRATELIRLLIGKYQFAPEKLAAAGYAEYHPVTSNSNAEGRAQNRRVDVVILRKRPSGTGSNAND